jgi:ABC-type transporter Mla MlaB component
MATDQEALDQLYVVPLDEFTSRRNALAKELAAAGDKDRAAEIKGLTKPSAAAWTLNQLAHTDAGGVAALLETADKLRAAQRGEGGDMRALNAEVRAEVTKLLGEAQAISESGGKKATQTLKNLVTQSLMAAAADEDAGALLQAGRLTRELEPGGFDSAADDAFVYVAGPARTPRRQEAEARASALAEEADAAEAEAKDLAKEADRAEREAVRARRKADEATAAAESKRAKATAAADALEQ